MFIVTFYYFLRDHLHIPDMILKLYAFLTFFYMSYFPYGRQYGSHSMQEQQKGQRILSAIFLKFIDN